MTKICDQPPFQSGDFRVASLWQIEYHVLLRLPKPDLGHAAYVRAAFDAATRPRLGRRGEGSFCGKLKPENG